MSFESKEFKVLTLTKGVDHVRVFEIDSKFQDNSNETDLRKSLETVSALT